MRSRVVYFIVVFASISLIGAACSAPPPPTPASQQITGNIGPSNNKTEMVVDQPTAFDVRVDPMEAKAKVSSVNVYPDGKIGGTCTPSDKSQFTWYCTPAKASQVGTIYADIRGDFPDIQAHYSVQVVASTSQKTEIPPSAIPETKIPPSPTPVITEPVTPTSTSDCTPYSRQPATTTTLTGTAKITSATSQGHPDGCPQTYDGGVTILGTAANLPTDVGIWILTYGKNNKYYPQSDTPGNAKPIRPVNDHWQGVAFIGTPDSGPETFDVVVVLANENASRIFSKQLKDGSDGKGWRPFAWNELPSGIMEVDHRTVYRDK
jgi:hypothetical protein